MRRTKKRGIEIERDEKEERCMGGETRLYSSEASSHGLAAAQALWQ
jgi:hypothetical protein